MIEDSLKKRYLLKLSSNIVSIIISAVIVSIVPRGLGPKAFGDFNFLNNFFVQLFPFFTLSTSIGFFTKLSQRQNEFGIISFYGRIVILAIILIILSIFASQLFGFVGFFWIGQKVQYVYMAAIFASLSWIINSLIQISDAYGITVATETAKIFQKLIGLMIILILFYSKNLNLTHYFFYNHFISLLFIVVLIILINKYGNTFFQKWKLGRKKLKNYINEFYSYSQPLFFYTVVGAFIGIFDRWILQKYRGSDEQGFFSLAMQIGIFCFMFTSAMTSLITREFSIAYKKSDYNEMGRIFRRYIPMLYSIAAFFGCFISIQADKVIFIFGGNAYANATIPMMIMAFYPIHQTYGQLSGSVFYATGQTKLYSKIGLFFMLLGLPMVYFATAPASQFGLDAGATGLAVKYVLLQFIWINVQLFYNTKFLNLQFVKFIAHQFISIIFFVILAFFSKYFIDELFAVSQNVIIRFLCSGILYSGLVVFLSIFIPQVFGLHQSDIRSAVSVLKLIIKK